MVPMWAEYPQANADDPCPFPSRQLSHCFFTKIVAPLLDIITQVIDKQSFPVLHHKYDVQFDEELVPIFGMVFNHTFM
jgi:hypothetical protein